MHTDSERPSIAERLEGRLARTLAGVPGSWLLRLIGEAPTVVDGQTLDPHLQFILAARRRKAQLLMSGPTPAQARARNRREIRAVTIESGAPPTVVGSVRDVVVDGAGVTLQARHYAPLHDATEQPLVVFFHGGGFVICDLDTHDEPCRMLAHHGGVHVLSVAYRLAPEHPFPTPMEDCCAALRWAIANAASLGADPARICTAGDSAGANLAAVAALAAAREGTPLAGQLLIYPTTDSRAETPSKKLFSDGYLLTSADMTAFTALYLSDDLELCADPRVSPRRSPDLAHSPPTVIVTAAFDPLRDEGEAYASALDAAGVTVRARRVAGLVHGFMHMTTIVPAAKAAMIDMARMFRRLLDETHAPR